MIGQFWFMFFRVSLQEIVGFAHGQHQELQEQQKQLLQAHNLLAINSKSMLEAQVNFYALLN